MTAPAHKELHAALRKTLGPGPGDEMIDLLAPIERDELARRGDVELLGTRLDTRIDALETRLDARIDALESRIDARITAEISRLLYVLVPIMVSLAALVFVAVKI